MSAFDEYSSDSLLGDYYQAAARDLETARDHEAAKEQKEPEALTVSAALNLAKGALESVVVTIIGEVSEVSNKPGYKAVYFSVKDSSATMPCMMWNNRYSAAGFDLAVGQLIQMTGRFSLYAAKGRMNFDAFSIALAGEGDLRMKVAQLAKRLKAEGLTDESRKRPIPSLPGKIGLVTSPRGAAVHDVLRTLRRRFGQAEVLLAGVPMEGRTAAAGMIEALACVANAGAEVILLVRGGGSFEDLMPFNDEALARAIAGCSVPVVTGVGHEVDTTIADMVSDFRASTPTGAAEKVSLAREDLAQRFASKGAAMAHALGRRLAAAQNRLGLIAAKPLFVDSMMLFAADAQRLDYLSERLSRVLPAQIERDATALAHQQERLLAAGPRMLEPYKAAMALGAARLQDLSPLSVLRRGYGIAYDNDGKVISRAKAVKPGENLSFRLEDGRLDATVKNVTLEGEL